MDSPMKGMTVPCAIYPAPATALASATQTKPGCSGYTTSATTQSCSSASHARLGRAAFRNYLNHLSTWFVVGLVFFVQFLPLPDFTGP